MVFNFWRWKFSIFNFKWISCLKICSSREDQKCERFKNKKLYEYFSSWRFSWKKTYFVDTIHITLLWKSNMEYSTNFLFFIFMNNIDLVLVSYIDTSIHTELQDQKKKNCRRKEKKAPEMMWKVKERKNETIKYFFGLGNFWIF